MDFWFLLEDFCFLFFSILRCCRILVGELLHFVDVVVGAGQGVEAAGSFGGEMRGKM